LLALLQALETQLSAAAAQLAKLQGDTAIQDEELRMVRMEMEGKAAQLREVKLQEQRQAADKVSQGPIVLGSALGLHPPKLQPLYPSLSSIVGSIVQPAWVLPACLIVPQCSRQRHQLAGYALSWFASDIWFLFGALLQDFEVRLAAVTAELQDKVAQQAAQLSSKADKLRLQGQELREVCAHRDHLNRTPGADRAGDGRRGQGGPAQAVWHVWQAGCCQGGCA
jgi:regulator of replication initiation timing